MSALVDDHERIWLQNAEDAKHQDTGRMWREDKVWPDNPEDGEPTEYVRADLFTTLQSRLETANRSAGEWEDLHRELFNAVYACTDPADKVCGLHPGPERDELEAVIGRHKTVHRREGPYASSVSYKARLEAVEAERDDALNRADELESSAEVVAVEFEKECWKAMRRLLDACHFPWSDIDCGEGVSADDAEEHIKTTLDEMERDIARQQTRAEAAKARVEELQKALERVAAWDDVTLRDFIPAQIRKAIDAALSPARTEEGKP